MEKTEKPIILNNDEKIIGFNQDKADISAKHNCPKCYGRGFVVIQTSKENGMPIEKRYGYYQFPSYCTCVVKKIEKERLGK